jgi:hypothetical protein
MKNRATLILLLLLSSSGVKAAGAPTALPQCAATYFRFSDNTVLLNVGPPHTRVFVLNNTANVLVGLNHTPQHPSASAGWSSQLAANNWSALLLQANQHNVVWTCNKRQGDKTVAVACKNVLKICSMIVANNPQKGSFWITENQVSATAVKRAVERAEISS